MNRTADHADQEDRRVRGGPHFTDTNFGSTMRVVRVVRGLSQCSTPNEGEEAG